MRAGVGWEPGVVGVATVGADLDSPAGYALRTGKPVISNHLENEERFRTPQILREYGVHRAMNVILQGDGPPFGVLKVDSRSDDEFVENDLAFLQGAANLLGMAIERERYERSLRAALDRQGPARRDEPPGQEQPDDRLQHASAAGERGRRRGADAIRRGGAAGHGDRPGARPALARLRRRADGYRPLHRGGLQGSRRQRAALRLRSEVQPGIEIASDRAISTALIVNELIANAAKYALPTGPAARSACGFQPRTTTGS